MSLPNLNMNTVLGMLATAQTVFEVVGSYINGKWVSSQLDDRTIRAHVLNADAEQIKLALNGNITTGGLAIHTKQTLYYQDGMNFEYQSEMENSPGIEALPFGTPTRGQNPPQMKQSFIRYKGRIFRIMGEGFTNDNHFVYMAVRYIDYNSDAL